MLSSPRSFALPLQIVALHATYDDVIVCPGLVGSFASRVDPKGRLRIPGALTGAREARRCLKGWHKRAEDSEKVTWWLEQLKERNIEPITVSAAAVQGEEAYFLRLLTRIFITLPLRRSKTSSMASRSRPGRSTIKSTMAVCTRAPRPNGGRSVVKKHWSAMLKKSES